MTAASSLTEIRTALNSQYYNKLAREAAESGAARATACLQENGFVAQWSTNPLRPHTSCSGGIACPADNPSDSCFVVKSGEVRTSFEVAAPEDETVSQSIKVTGKTELLRTSSGKPWKTFTQVIKTRVGIDLTFNKVVFGYTRLGTGGAFFYTIGADGQARGTGYNEDGQLGLGHTSSVLTPSRVSLPDGANPSSIYASFVSHGYNSFILADNGNVYGAGRNGDGQIGDGSRTNRSTMTRYRLPSGKIARHVAPLGTATFVVTTDNNIYAAGNSQDGRLGIGSLDGSILPTRVQLPTPNPSDPNTIPTNDIVADRFSAFVRMEGGAVYGWGSNNRGQLANGGTSDSFTPVRIGDYGKPGYPKAVDIAFDGVTIYIVGDDGEMQAAGYNYFGQLGRTKNMISNRMSGKCIDNASNSSSNGNPITIWSCVNGSPNQEWQFTEQGQIRHTDTNKCLDDSTSTDANGTLVHLWTCSDTNANQLWRIDSSNRIVNIASGKCLDVDGDKTTNGRRLMIWSCSNVTQQYWDFKDSTALAPVEIVPAAKKYQGKLVNLNANMCADNRGGSSTNGNEIMILTCGNDTNRNHMWTMNEHGQIVNPFTGKCLDDGGSTDSDGTKVHLWSCSTTQPNQIWHMDDAGRIVNTQSGKCLAVSGDGLTLRVPLEIWTCGNSMKQRWEFGDDKIVQVSTDQWFAAARTANGEVWSVGLNESGSFGNGRTDYVNTVPQKFPLPNGVKAVDVYVTATSAGAGYSNIFVVGDNGRVYGAGHNSYGQIGMGITSTRRTTPEPMRVIWGTSIRAKKVMSGYGTTVVMTENGKIYTVGNNSNGQLGDGTTNNSSIPRANRYTNVVPLTVF